MCSRCEFYARSSCALVLQGALRNGTMVKLDHVTIATPHREKTIFRDLSFELLPAPSM